jgi:cell division protein FtsQ
MYFTQSAQGEKVMDQPLIDIEIIGDNAFLNTKEVIRRLEHAHLIHQDQPSDSLDIEKIESFIKSISQVKSTKVYQLIGGQWKIEMELREPVARIFNKYDEDFYLDSDGYVMSTSAVHTSHIVVVTGEIVDRENSIPVPEIINNDSLISIRKLDDIYRISNYVCKDPLFRSLIGQIHLERNGDFVLIPLVGEQKIIFGSAYSEKEVEDKFQKLRIFYKEAMPYEGWDKYSEISLKYKDQIVCKTVEESAE